MKTRNLILSIILVALATTAFGQRPTIKERLFPNQNLQVEFITAGYSMETSRLESLRNDIRIWINNKLSRKDYATPVVEATIFLEGADICYEEEQGVESWMVTPFKNNLGEKELYVETWMSTPFESNLGEEELYIEAWMTAPFEDTFTEEELILESWMTVPFVVEEQMEVESWMATAWI